MTPLLKPSTPASSTASLRASSGMSAFSLISLCPLVNFLNASSASEGRSVWSCPKALCGPSYAGAATILYPSRSPFMNPDTTRNWPFCTAAPKQWCPFPSCVDQKGLVGCGLACLLTGSVNILHGHFEGEHVHHDGAIDIRV